MVVGAWDFTFPPSALRIAPVLRASRAIERREFVATFEFGDAVADSPETKPEGLLWSTAFDLPFMYVPATGPEASRNNVQLLSLGTFALPSGAQSLRMCLRSWKSQKLTSGHPFSEAVLETRMNDRPALILADK